MKRLHLVAPAILAFLVAPAVADDSTLVPLRITTDPLQATINVDDEYVGETGASKELEVAPGKHEVLLYKEGYLIEVRQIEAATGTPVDLQIPLTPDVEIPHAVSIERAPKFVSGDAEAGRILATLLELVTDYHVQEVGGGAVVLNGFETVVKALQKIRERETLLSTKYAPEFRKRIYGAEADLTAYPELTLAETPDGARVQFVVSAGTARRTIALDKSDPAGMLRELPGFYTWLEDSWDSRRLITRDAFYYMVVQGMIGFLEDQFTYFISPDEAKEMRIDTSQKLGGLGMQVSKVEDGLEVIAPIEDSPAFAAGVLEGDVITMVGDEATKDMTLHAAVGKLRGEPGTQVSFTIRRKGTPEPIRMTLTRAIVEIKYLKSRMLENGIGYIRLTSFMGEQVGADFEKALSDLESSGMKALVIDLRGNPGGLMTVALEIVDLFVEDGLTFEVRARVDELAEKHYARKEGTHGPYPIAVLINKGSASASEIVAGILKEKGLASVVGARSYGKGSVQRILPLGRGEDPPSVALTIALYYLLGKTKVHEVGIEPDYPVEVAPEVEAKLARQSIYSKEDPAAEDARLRKAIEVLEEKLRSR